jgi:hypothetical protein
LQKTGERADDAERGGVLSVDTSINGHVAATGIELRTKAVTRETVGNGRVQGVLLEDSSTYLDGRALRLIEQPNSGNIGGASLQLRQSLSIRDWSHDLRTRAPLLPRAGCTVDSQPAFTGRDTSTRRLAAL